MNGLNDATAFVALSSVSVVLWTGGLIVLQLKRTIEGYTQAQHHLINGAMACAAYSFLAPLLGLVAVTESPIRNVAIGAAVLYVVITIGNARSIVQGLASGNDDLALIGVLYLLPTVALIILAFRPFAETITWSSGLLLFASYFALSHMARRFP